MRIGYSSFIQREDDASAVEDENGQDFPDLATAIYEHAKEVMTVTWLPRERSLAVPHAEWLAATAA